MWTRIFLIFGLSFMMLACNKKPDVVLTRSELKLADSLFLVHRTEWSVRLEDSCTAFRSKMLPVWTDSLKELRLSEINLMLDEYAKEK